MVDESDLDAEETTSEPFEEERTGSGLGFVLGIMLGLIAGAAAATLFAPSTGQEFRRRVSEEAGPVLQGAGGNGHAPGERIRGVLSRVRARVQEASEEAKEAARQAEEASRARYSELTGDEEENETS